MSRILFDAFDVVIAGTGSVEFGVPGLTGTGTIDEDAIAGAGGISIPPPALSGSGTVAVTEVTVWGPGRNPAGRPFPPPPEPPKQVVIRGHGGISVPVPVSLGTGSISISGSGSVHIATPNTFGAGTHQVPIIAGTGAIAVSISITGEGFVDLRPVEEEEMALLLAAA